MVISLAKTAFKTSKREYFAAAFAFFIAFSVFLLVDSLSRAVVSQVELEARPVLGADVVANSSVQFSNLQESAVFEHCKNFGATCSKKISFSSTLSDFEGKTALVQVVGVEAGYPYYGNFEFTPFGTGWAVGTAVSESVPSQNGFLADSSVISRFASGGTFPFFWKTLRAEGVVRKSSETGFSFGDDNGTVYVSYALAVSVPEITSLSRAQFSILMKTPDERRADELTEVLKSDARLSDLRIRSFRWGASGAARVVDDVSAYVSEAIAVVFFLAWTAAFFFSKAVWMANRKYFSILRMLGASRFSIAWAFVVFFLSAAFAAAVFALLLSAFVLNALPLPESFGAPTIGAREVFRLAATFPFVVLPAAVPGVVSVFSTSPLSWLGEPKIALPKFRHGLSAFLWTFSASFLFLLGVSWLSVFESATKAAGVIAAIAWTLLLSYGAIRVCAWAFRNARENDFAFVDAVRLAVSPWSPAFPVVSAFVVPAVLLASFSSLAFHFSDELERMSHSWYDVFALNLKASDASAVRSAFPNSEAYSIIRARVSKINGKNLREHLNGEPSREFSREFNVTSSDLPDAVIGGEDRPVRIGEVSLDDEFSKSLGISVGDLVTFSVMGREFELRAVNVRESDREGIRPFFYFSVAEGEFARLPPSYFVAASVADTEAFKSETLRLSGSYVSFVDVREAVEIVRSAASRILPAVWAFLAAVAALSVTVAVAALSSLKGFRAAREKTYRAVGATRIFLRKQALYTLSFYVASAFLAASVVAFPAVWWGIASVSFLTFSFSAATKAVAVLFGFLVFASLAVAGFEKGT